MNKQLSLFTLLKEGERAVTHKDLLNVFFWGVDYGQLLMEEERGQEEWTDAAAGYAHSLKCAMPSYPIERRQLHSEKWFEAKRESYRKFKDFIIGDKL